MIRKYRSGLKLITALLSAIAMISCQKAEVELPGYYIDSANGADNNSGTSKSSPWKTLSKVSNTRFQPGDNIFFKRGSKFSGCATINGDGTAEKPILITAYGEGDPPLFTNPDVEHFNGNAMQIRGDYQIIENLYFEYCAPAKPRSGFVDVWKVGALHVGLGNDHVIIRNNEFAHNAKAIQSYSEYSKITQNYIHHGNEKQQDGFLSAPYWGPIGIHLGIGNQEVSYNRVEHMYVEGGEWGGDGGAIEIDDGRNHKDNFYIHHNTTKENMGFLEISYTHDIQKNTVSNIVVEYNISDDYQDFVLWWAPSSNSFIRNNTIIRTNFVAGLNLNCVFCVEDQPPVITKNIVITNNKLETVFGCADTVPAATHFNNCYWDIDDGKVDMGTDWGEGEITADPLFINYDDGDYKLQTGSPAAGLGAF